MDDYLKRFNEVYEEKCKMKYPPSVLDEVNRIIVIGDIHGDMEKLYDCLIIGKLIDRDGNWIGGETVVVQVGDQIDSCRVNCDRPDNDTKSDNNKSDVDILYFLTKLHKKASEKGGAVYSLMGNHEFMNVLGEFSYVSQKDFRSFKGIEGRKNAFKPGNEIANFLACTRKMALIIGSCLFVHGGIVPDMVSRYKIDDMNKLLALFLLDEFNDPNVFPDLFMNADTSPFWTRTYGMNIKDCESLLEPLKEVYKVGKIFVGHTPQMRTGIKSNCNDRIWLTDVGMSRAFNPISNNKPRKAQVLEILNDGKKINILK